MTHWRFDLAVTLRQLADELTHERAADVDRLMADAIDTGWPTRNGDPNGSGGGGNGSPVESRLNDDGHHHDSVAAQTRRMLAAQRRLVDDARAVLIHRRGWDPGRTIERYPDCGHPIDRNYRRCMVEIDGVQCGSGRHTERRCDTCAKVMEPGKPLRKARALDLEGHPEVHECDACRRHRARHGTSRVAVDALALDAGVLTPEGTWHG